MWHLFFIAFAIFNSVLIGYAAHVALSSQDRQQRKDAFKVLRLIWTTATGASGVVAVAIRLHELGLL